MDRGVLARALYTNTPEAKNELYFRKGDILTVIEIDCDNQPGWWLCSLRGQRGICPSNYLELIEDKYSLPLHPLALTHETNVRGGNRECESVLDPMETYDVPRSHNIPHDLPSSSSSPLSKVSPMELYDVPRSHIPIYAANSSESLMRGKKRQSELSLLSTGSSAHLSSSASSSSSSARSSASCDLNASSLAIQSSELAEDERDHLQPSDEPHNFFEISSGEKASSNSSSSINKGSISGQEETSGNIHQLTKNGTGCESATTTNQQLYQNIPHSSHHNSSHYPGSSSARSRSSAQSESNITLVSGAAAEELYDVPRSAPSSRAQSAMSMSSGLGLSIGNSDSKDSLDLYDVPRSSNVHAYVNHIETKYDRVHSRHPNGNGPSSLSSRNSCCSVNSYGKTSRTSESSGGVGGSSSGAHSFSDNNSRVKLSYEIGNGRGVGATKPVASTPPDDLYDVPRSSHPVVVRHPASASISSSLASMSISKESLCSSNNGHGTYRRNGSTLNNYPNTNNPRLNSAGSNVDLRRRGFIITPGNSTETLPCQKSFSQPTPLCQNQHSADDIRAFGDEEQVQGSQMSLHQTGRTTASAGFHNQSDSREQSNHTVEDVKILPLNPRAAVTVCEKLRQEVVTSINCILEFVRPKWRVKDNLNEIMPELRFACIRLNLAIKDMVDFCSRSVSNAKKFSIDVLVTKLQRLLTPLINGSQIVQRDVDELEAYFWSVDRLSVSANYDNKVSSPDALDQLVLCARSLLHDVTEIANFLALNSSALYRDSERQSLPTIVVAPTPVTVTENNEYEGPTEDYDYVSLVPVDQVDGACGDAGVGSQVDGGGASVSLPHLVLSDQLLLEFYSTQIATISPLLSLSISTFISSIQQNDPPKTFNGHLKYVILLAYKMLFAGDTVHRNICNVEIKEEIESKANDLHKSVVTLHEASRVASRDFPRIPPMQNIVDRVWETTAAATQLKKVMLSAACF